MSLHLAKVSQQETDHGHCPYCQQTTTWSIQVVGERQLRFECTRCCKISRDVVVAPRG